MGKWVIILVTIAAGLGIWLFLDPAARATAAEAWSSIAVAVRSETGGVDAASLWAPVGRAFQGFADSVASMWSPDTIRIELPRIQVQP